MNRYDADPDAVAWARGHVQREIDRAERFQATSQATSQGDAEFWRKYAWLLRHTFIGGEGCVIAAFDWRRPTFALALNSTIDPLPGTGP